MKQPPEMVGGCLSILTSMISEDWCDLMQAREVFVTMIDEGLIMGIGIILTRLTQANDIINPLVVSLNLFNKIMIERVPGAH